MKNSCGRSFILAAILFLESCHSLPNYGVASLMSDAAGVSKISLADGLALAPKKVPTQLGPESNSNPMIFYYDDGKQSLQSTKLGDLKKPEKISVSQVPKTQPGPREENALDLYQGAVVQIEKVSAGSYFEKIKNGLKSWAPRDYYKPGGPPIPPYPPMWLSANGARYNRLDRNILQAVSDRFGGDDFKQGRMLQVQLTSDVKTWKEMSNYDRVSLHTAKKFFVEALGEAEVNRRIAITDNQIFQARIAQGWKSQEIKIANSLKAPLWEVENSGKLLGGNKFFPAFEDLDTAKTLDAIEDLQKSGSPVFKAWADYLGPAELKRRLELLNTLNTYKSVKLSPEVLSAWQMQGLNLKRMLAISAYIQPAKVGSKMSLAEKILSSGNLKQQQAIKQLFSNEKGSEALKSTLEHKELQKYISKNQYLKVRNAVHQSFKEGNGKNSPLESSPIQLSQALGSMSPEKSSRISSWLKNLQGQLKKFQPKLLFFWKSSKNNVPQ